MGFLSNLLKVLTPPGGTVSIEKLQTQLTSLDTKVRENAVEQLGEIPTAQTVRMLADIIRHDEVFTVRRKAVIAFEKVGQKGAKGDHELLDALAAAGEDLDPQVRSCSESALEAIRKRVPD